MTKLPVYNLEGKETGNINLDDNIFAVKKNDSLLYEVIKGLRNNIRRYTAHTKLRGERRGGGRKPWKQKGTGRARAGSIRSPIWRKGGVTFGPRNERNYTQKINRKVRQKALMISLSGKIEDKEMTVLEDWKLKGPKTKELAKGINSLKLKGTILAVTAKEDKMLKKAGSNLDSFSIQTASDLNPLEVLNSKNLLIEKEAVKILEDRLKREVKREKKVRKPVKKTNAKKK